MSQSQPQDAKTLRSELEEFLSKVSQRHERVNPCFMTGKGCVYTDHIDQVLKLRRKHEACSGFMIMPFRPELGVFFKNCLLPFFNSTYGRDNDLNVGPQFVPRTFTLERADDVSRPGIIICEGICKRIQEADFVVAEVSVPNDNVFYELGLAYGIGHKILLLHQREAEFGLKWTKYLRPEDIEHTEYTAKQYDSLQVITGEQFKASQYIWKRPTTQNEGNVNPEVLFFEMMGDGKKEPDPLPTGMHDDDITLSFRTHVMSDIGLALSHIASDLDQQQERGESIIPAEYLDGIIKAHLDKASIIEPTDPFNETRTRIDKCYCLIVRTGFDCHPMSYFWLGYGHARGKNVIPVTQLIREEEQGGTDIGSDKQDRTHNDHVSKGDYRTDGAKGKIMDLAFDIRAQRHMTFDPQQPELLEHQLEQTLKEMIHTDFSEWSRKRFWVSLLGSRGEVSIITGGLHSKDHNREMIGDWDLRAASELTSYFSRHQYRPKIETPIYQPEFAKQFDRSMSSKKYIEQVTKEIRIADKTCIVIASPDVNPLTEILLGRLFGVADDILFTDKLKVEDYPEAKIVYKERKKPQSDKRDNSKSKPRIKTKAPRAFYQEVVGNLDIEKRGFRSRAFAGNEYKSLPYYGQNEYEKSEKESFNIYSQLVIARNPFSSPDSPPRYVIILNGVSGPATFALTHVLTGGGNEEFESYRQLSFDPAAASESILNKFLSCISKPNFNGIESVIEVQVGEQPSTEYPGEDTSKEKLKARSIQGAGATFDWRRILSWKLDNKVLGNGVREF